ncbi:hypothetical protein P3T76_003046 [Phytophthora citrophthora]|uniref:CWH43-like N-terminal domain-containing protein n=1 Tax=Phytophthora citrophthora TaxID=4793 RepID=A0AAD9LQI2_9STRA|nr:hypothetical protein P3T76_003046 [Phytophthora citrophthora]
MSCTHLSMMTTMQPIPFSLRNPLQTDLTRQLEDSEAESSDSDVSSSSEGSTEASSSDVDSISESSFSTSDQEEDDLSGHSSSSSEDELRPPSSTGYRLEEFPASRSITDELLDTLGDMARTDNVGYIAWLVPFTGIFTMLGTEFLACVNHFTCSQNFPTLSYAATFRPEGYAFTGGMCLTAMFILASVVLFFWYLQLRMRPHELDGSVTGAKHLVAGYACLVSGVTAAISLFGLAVMDMRTHHDAHINFTIAFFVAAWATMIAVQIARKSILHEDESEDDDGKSATGTELIVVLRRQSFWLSLRRWRKLDVNTAYNLGRLLLNVGLASTVLFGVFFLCANGIWPNPLGFTAVQEAFFEALAIVCQLLFMGTLSCELARLTRLVERSDYAELERNE